MKTVSVPCRQVRYKEFPELLFGTSRDGGPCYFDATRFIRARGNGRRHDVEEFRHSFRHWIEALSGAYGIDTEDLVVRDGASGHLLIDECLALLFVVYIEPSFGVYMLERLSEMLADGFSVSDTWLARAAGLRFTREVLTQILDNYETKQF